MNSIQTKYTTHIYNQINHTPIMKISHQNHFEFISINDVHCYRYLFVIPGFQLAVDSRYFLGILIVFNSSKKQGGGGLITKFQSSVFELYLKRTINREWTLDTMTKTQCQVKNFIKVYQKFINFVNFTYWLEQ